MLLQRLLLFAFAALLISLKGDGRFPLPKTLPDSTFQLLLLPYTILFIITILLYFKKTVFLPRVSEKRSLIPFTVIMSIFFLSITVFIFLGEAKSYSQFGYHVNHLGLTILYLISVGLLLHLLRKQPNHERVLFYVLLIFVGWFAFNILSFPIHTGRSDMLPIIQAAGSRFLAKANPYGTYFEPQPVPLTYLPGMWMAYLPAVFLHFDLRIIHSAAIIATVLIIYFGTKPDKREMIATLCSLFLLTPYLLYRHEIYLGIFWLSLSLVYFFDQRNKPIWSSLWIGIAAAISQFAWVLIPLFVLAIYKRFGKKIALYSCICFSSAFLILVLPFVLRSPEAFYTGVFAHWTNTLNVTTLNLSYFIASNLSITSLKYFQVLITVVIYILAVKQSDTRNRIYEFMTYSLLFFILLNPLIWVYFYLVLFPLMIMDASVKMDDHAA
jgi:hypothetical protein